MRVSLIGLLCAVALILGAYWWKDLNVQNLTDETYADLRRLEIVSEVAKLSEGTC